MNNITDISLLTLTTALAITTFIHHVYGGIKYYTPKVNRLKIAGLIVITYGVTLALHTASQHTHWVSYVYNGLILVWWVGGFGIFEGGYNHLLKVALWAARVKPAKLQKLFPPDEYVLPNDIIFEGSGIVTFVIGLFVAAKLIWS